MKRKNGCNQYAKGNAEHTLEIDFLIVREYEDAALRPRVSPIEVKSGRTYGTASLERFRTLFGGRVGTEYVLHPKELSTSGNRVVAPLYMAGCL